MSEQNEQRILALDCAAAVGWACNCAGLASGVEQFGLRRMESHGMRYLRFRAWLREMLLQIVRPEVVIYEAPIVYPGRPSGAEVAFAFTSRVQEEAEAAGLQYVAVPPALLKRFATGKGNADKGAMVAEADRRWGPFLDRQITDDNEADALLLLSWGLAGYPEMGPAKRTRKKGGR